MDCELRSGKWIWDLLHTQRVCVSVVICVVLVRFHLSRTCLLAVRRVCLVWAAIASLVCMSQGILLTSTVALLRLLPRELQSGQFVLIVAATLQPVGALVVRCRFVMIVVVFALGVVSRFALPPAWLVICVD